MADSVTGTGTPDDPWVLRTPPGSWDYRMHRDDTTDPPELVCQVGSTKLRYLARCLEDVPAMLETRSDWSSGVPTRTSRPRTAPSKPGPVPTRTRSAAGTGSARAIAAASPCTCRPCSSVSASPSSSTTRATTGYERAEAGIRVPHLTLCKACTLVTLGLSRGDDRWTSQRCNGLARRRSESSRVCPRSTTTWRPHARTGTHEPSSTTSSACAPPSGATTG